MIRTSNRARPTMGAARNEAGVGGEREIVARLLDEVAEAGLSMDPSAIVDFYVAVRSNNRPNGVGQHPLFGA